MARPTDHSDVRLAKEGPMPGYTGHVPGVKSHVMGHSYSDASKRGVAITDSLRHNKFGRAIHLSTENRQCNRDDFHAQLSQPREKTDPRELEWRCMRKETPEESRLVSGKVDMHYLRSISAPQHLSGKNKQCIGTTDGPATETKRTMSIGALPYKDCRLTLRKEYGARGPEYCETKNGEHHVPGYTGHTHAEQHVFARTYGKTTQELRQFPAEPSTSAKYLDYAENRPLVVNEYELNHPMKFKHFQLLNAAEGDLGPLPEGTGPSYPYGVPRDCDTDRNNSNLS